MSQQATLLDQILSGANRNLQVMAAQGLVPLPPEQLIPIQVALTSSPDAEISSKAGEALVGIEEHVATEFLRHQASERELRYFGLFVQRSTLLEAVLRRPDVPRNVLRDMATQLTPDMQEILIHRQDAILDEPEILVAFESNPQLSNYVKRRIWEYREHLLPKEKVPHKKAEEILAEADAITEEEMAEAIAEVQAKAEVEEDEAPVDEKTGLKEAEVRLLPVPMRVKLARNADRQLRNLLIRDTNAQVAVTVITSNSIPDSEVEQIASSRSVCEEVLKEIPKRREWIRRYSIAKSLVKNPKTPLHESLRLVPRMVVRDLRDLAKDKNVPDGVRSTALRLYQAKR
ncbi:MAG: hypothetical protein AAGN66_04330 [Acidobacteriota bacterium]